MEHIQNFESFLNEAQEIGTQKSAALDFVEKQGKATWKEIHSFLMKNKNLDPNDPANRGNMSSYFSASSGYTKKGLLMTPTMKDPRYLEKQDDGTYVVKVWDKKSKLD